MKYSTLSRPFYSGGLKAGKSFTLDGRLPATPSKRLSVKPYKMKIEFKSNYAAHSYRMTAEIGEDVNPETQALALQGLANICYRTVGSNVDKALGIKSKKDGGMGRAALVYRAEDANRIDIAVSAKLTELEAADNGALKPLKMSFACTGEYVGGESKPSQEATALWTVVQGKPEAEFAANCKVLGIDVDDYDDARGIAACQKFLVEAKRKAVEAAKGLLK